MLINCMLLPVLEAIILKTEKKKIFLKSFRKGGNCINCNCVINSVENGALNLIDVWLKIKSLKATWIHR